MTTILQTTEKLFLRYKQKISLWICGFSRGRTSLINWTAFCDEIGDLANMWKAADTVQGIQHVLPQYPYSHIDEVLTGLHID